jgi:hypothetical protein
MGDIFSTKKNETVNTTLNQQVALQGRGQLGVSGSQINGNISVETSDPEVVTEAIRVAGMSSNAVAIVSARALDVANTAIVTNGAQYEKSLEFLENTQKRNLETVDASVGAAQETALLATPQSPAAYGEITGAQGNKSLLIAGAVIVALWFLNRNKPA